MMNNPQINQKIQAKGENILGQDPGQQRQATTTP